MSKAKKKEEIVKKSWEDSFPSEVTVTVKLNGKQIIKKRGGKR